MPENKDQKETLILDTSYVLQKQASRDVLQKRCSENW